jgi:hypothetical protein
VKEATISLREIAEKHELSPQDLSARFTSGAKPPTSTTTPKSVDPASDAKSGTLEEPSSAIEQKINEKAAGPDLPDLVPEDEDDLFE